MELKKIIRLKELFSLVGSIIMGYGLYLELDGYKHSLFGIILLSLFILLIPFIWSEWLYSSILDEQTCNEHY